MKKPPKATETALGESDSDTPLGEKLTKEKAVIEKRAEKEAKAILKEEKKSKAAAAKKKEPKKEELETPESTPPKKKRKTNGTVSAKKQANGVKKDDSEDDVPLSRKAPAKKIKAEPKAEPSTPAKKGSKSKAATKKEADEEDEAAEAEEEEYRWWENPTKGDGSIKWTTLEHAGVVFPPLHDPLPKNVKLYYDGVPVTLAPEAEEIACFFGSMLNSTHNVENPTFQKNFFEDFSKALKNSGGAKDKDGNKLNIKEFEKCDFKKIFEYYDTQRTQKKALPAAEKKRLKAEKDAAEAPYMYCMWDGRKQKVGNFRVEPPGLFRGRGEHPKTGKNRTICEFGIRF